MSSGDAEVSCPPKGGPTTPQEDSDSQQVKFDTNTRVEDYTLSLSDFQLPGLGEPGEICGKNRLPEKNAICPNGDAVRYEPHLCRNVECPNCYLREDRERAFKLAVAIEGVARIREERPHALTMSVPDEEGRNYSIKNINNQLMERGRRRAKRKSGVLGGVSVVHPARIPDKMKDLLRGEGYGSNGDKGGLWEGVRDDVLGLGDWREYCKYSPHAHNIGFPEYLDKHSGDDFLVRKYDVLEDTESVVYHLRYLMTHRGMWNGPDQFTSIRRWGMFHHASKHYIDVEEQLQEEEYREICEEVAEIMGAEWDGEEGLHYPVSDEKCPECGTPKNQFVDLWDLTKLASCSRQGGQEWQRRLSDEQLRFFETIIEILHNAVDPIIFYGDLKHPDDIEVWVDGDLPPPET